MPNTYTRIYIHVVFAVKYRMPLIGSLWKGRLHRYIAGIIGMQGSKLIIVNSVQDHIHILVGMKPHIALSDLVRDIKRDSTAFINENRMAARKFAWQEGYGAFSYSRADLGRVARYIQQQEVHHRRRSFEEEYRLLLKRHHVKFEERYLLDRQEP